MRARFAHVLAGVLLGTALAVLFSVHGHVLAHEEPVPSSFVRLSRTATGGVAASALSQAGPQAHAEAQGRAAGRATAGRQDRRANAVTASTSAPAEQR
jgi:hypothetical protein